VWGTASMQNLPVVLGAVLARHSDKPLARRRDVIRLSPQGRPVL
jgi:hypothetical protein